MKTWTPSFFLTLSFSIAVAGSARADTTLFADDGIDGNIYQISGSTVTTFATVPGTVNLGGMAFDGSGNLYVTDTLNSQIFQISSSGGVSTFATLPDQTAGLVYSNGNLYTGGANTGTLYQVNSGGTVTNFASLSNPASALAVDSSGNIYAESTSSNVISKVDGFGGVSSFATLFSSGSGSGLAVDSAGNVYASDYLYDTVEQFNSTGALLNTFGGNPLPGGTAPVGLALDISGNLYVADRSNQAIQQFDASGNPVATLGSGNLPNGVNGIAASNLSPAPEPSGALLPACVGLLMLGRRRRRGV